MVMIGMKTKMEMLFGEKLRMQNTKTMTAILGRILEQNIYYLMEVICTFSNKKKVKMVNYHYL